MLTLSSEQGLRKAARPRGPSPAPRAPGAAAQGSELSAHTHPRSCPRGPAGSHPCSAAWTRSRRSPRCCDRQNSPCSCGFPSGTRRYLFSTPKHHPGVSSGASRKEIRRHYHNRYVLPMGNLRVKCVCSGTSLRDLSGPAANLIWVPPASFNPQIPKCLQFFTGYCKTICKYYNPL